jgi:hypothetical protein
MLDIPYVGYALWSCPVVEGLLALHDSLDFFETGLSQSTGEHTLFEESGVSGLLDKFPKFIWAFKELPNGFAYFVIDDQKLEQCHSAEVPSTIAPLADFDLDGIPLGIDALFGGRRNRRLVKLGHPTGG